MHIIRKGAVRSHIYENYNRNLPADSPTKRNEVQHCWLYKVQY